TPRTTADVYEDAVKYGKLIKTESRTFEEAIGKGKPYEGVNTIKERGRSIHEIPRQDQPGQDMRKTPDLADRRVMEGSISQNYSLGQPTIKHNVKSLITSPSKLPHSMPQLETMERAKYEEGKAVRHSVVNSTASVLRSTHQEASKSQHSPSMYEDAGARRTPVTYTTNPVSRGSPMLGRASEVTFYSRFNCFSYMIYEHVASTHSEPCVCLCEGGMSSAKSASHDRKSSMTPTQRDSIPSKSPVSVGDPVASHSPFDPHHRPVVPGEVQPSPTGYHNTYQLYTMENTRQTILNDYITSQQMHGIPRPDMARGLSPREQPVAISYPAPPRGMSWLSTQPPYRQVRTPPSPNPTPCFPLSLLPRTLCFVCMLSLLYSGHPAHLAASAEREQQDKDREKEREQQMEREIREREWERTNEYMRGADALAALVDATAYVPQMDVGKVKESRLERDDEMSSSAASRRGPILPEQQQQQQQQEAERRSLHSPYSTMSLPGGKPHPVYGEGHGVGGKEKGPQTKSRIEEELRTHGKTTITAANFIDVIITRQIASDKESRERGSQSSDSSSSCE
ncbi:hypothetical protein XENOCAPTIV_018275, partial [Xenoophorus captivus]